ncbi:MAG: hypothetical protein U9Q77_10875 [Candidatus Marinimicrobia bacterium]|nr:hypothetical protein [Candidatus Neomarinimicrobiota bacterium]
METYHVDTNRRPTISSTFTFTRWWIYLLLIMLLSLGKNLLG